MLLCRGQILVSLFGITQFIVNAGKISVRKQRVLTLHKLFTKNQGFFVVLQSQVGQILYCGVAHLNVAGI